MSEVAARLQAEGLIAYHRGHITVVDRPALEHSSCECYRASKRAYRQVMGIPER